MGCKWGKVHVSPALFLTQGVQSKGVSTRLDLRKGILRSFSNGSTAILYHWFSISSYCTVIYVIICLTFLAFCLFCFQWSWEIPHLEFKVLWSAEVLRMSLRWHQKKAHKNSFRFCRRRASKPGEEAEQDFSVRAKVPCLSRLVASCHSLSTRRYLVILYDIVQDQGNKPFGKT